MNPTQMDLSKGNKLGFEKLKSVKNQTKHITMCIERGHNQRTLYTDYKPTIKN